MYHRARAAALLAAPLSLALVAPAFAGGARPTGGPYPAPMPPGAVCAPGQVPEVIVERDFGKFHRAHDGYKVVAKEHGRHEIDLDSSHRVGDVYVGDDKQVRHYHFEHKLRHGHGLKPPHGKKVKVIVICRDVVTTITIVKKVVAPGVPVPPGHEDEHGQKPPKDEHGQKPPKDEHGQKPPKDEHGQKPPKDDHGQKPPKDDHGHKPPKDDHAKTVKYAVRRHDARKHRHAGDEHQAKQRFPFTVTGEAPFTLAGGEAKRFDDVKPGHVAVDEGKTPGFVLVAVVCKGVKATSTATGAGLDVVAGAHIVCVFYNKPVPVPPAPKGVIVIDKATTPAGSPQTFTFTPGGTLGTTQFTLTDQAQPKVFLVDAGQATVTEAPTQGWKLTDVRCDDADSSGSITTATATIKVAPGEVVTCRFVNEQQPPVVQPPVEQPPAQQPPAVQQPPAGAQPVVTTTPPAVTTPAAPNAGGVLGQTVRSASARLSGPRACVARTFSVRITGTRIARVTVSVNGLRAAVVRGTVGRRLYAISVRARGGRVQRVVARVTFRSGSSPAARTLRMTAFRCATAALRPQFTG